MKKILHAFVIIAICINFYSCNNNKSFNSEEWAKIDDIGNYPERDKMLNDFKQHQDLKGKRYQNVILLLGNPDITSKNVLQYVVVTEYGTDIDPVYIKYLDIYLQDSIVKEVGLSEFKM